MCRSIARRGGLYDKVLGVSTEKRDGFHQSNTSYFVVPLMGQSKGDTGVINEMLVLAEKTKGGFVLRKWVNRLIRFMKSKGKDNMVRPDICDTNGYFMQIWNLNSIIHNVLEKVHIVKGALITIKDVHKMSLLK